MRNNQIKTYGRGRHKQRVIVSDLWCDSSDSKGKNVFCSSSENDSKHSSIFSISSSSSDVTNPTIDSTESLDLFTGKPSGKRNTRQKKTSANKENVPRQTKQSQKKQTDRLLSVPAVSRCLRSSPRQDCDTDISSDLSTRMLRTRSDKVDYNDSGNLKKQLGHAAVARRKRPVRKAAEKQQQHKESSVNFSDFDDYSLIIQENSVDSKKDVSCSTSTPVGKRAKETFEVENSNISRIDVVVSPSSDTCYTSLETPFSAEPESRNLRRSARNHGENFASPLVSVPAREHLSPENNHSEMNGSEDLFSSPVSISHNLKLLTSKLKKISFIETDDDIVEGTFDNVDDDYVTEKLEESEEQEEEEEEGEEETEEDYEEAEEEEAESEVEMLSVLIEHSDEEDDEDEEDEDEEEQESSENMEPESTEELSESIGEGASDSKEEFHKNLRNLNESLQNHRISLRGRNVRRERKVEKIEPLLDESPQELSLMETSNSGTSLYMINSDVKLDSVVNDDDNVDVDDDGDENREMSSEVESSSYKTASPVKDSDNQSSEGHNIGQTDEDGEVFKTAMDLSCRVVLEKLNTPKRQSLRDRCSQHSFSEMLTPVKKSRKGSLVPVPARTKVMALCDQTQPVSFTVALTKTVLTKCKKIGEGVYGEVFRSCRKGQSVAIKIIPIEGDFLVNDEPQKKFDEILPEIVIAKELSDLRYSDSCMTSSFCEVMNVSCVKGKYPAALLRQWDDFHKRKTSENDRPDMFKDDQLYIVFEFADCGTALESYKFDNLQQSKSILAQVTFALAAAEDSLMFEHRDLHWGNVLVRPTDEEEIMYRLGNMSYRVPTMGLEANIIDFTLSRLTKDGCKVYSDLSKDDALFQGKGDYQFDIYRKMKDENGNDWAKFCPFTNVLWLHYLADKLVYRNTTSLKSREERDTLRQFRQFLVEMLNFTSATHMAKESLFLNS